MEDRFNESMSCITQFVVLHAFLRRSQMLLRSIRHQVMCSLVCLTLRTEVTCKGYILTQ